MLLWLIAVDNIIIIFVMIKKSEVLICVLCASLCFEIKSDHWSLNEILVISTLRIRNLIDHCLHRVDIPEEWPSILIILFRSDCIIITTINRDRKSFQWNTPRLYSGSFINTYILCSFLNLIVDHTNSDHLLNLYFPSISALELPTIPAIALNPTKLILVRLRNAENK